MKPYQAIVWNDNLATGVEEIDDQHRILVKTLNEAGARLGEQPDRALLDTITRDLLSYAIYHFETEEELMLQTDYLSASPDDEAKHRAQHRAFSARVVAVREAIARGQLVGRDELMNFLNDWLVNHIMATDQKLAAHIRARRAGG